MAQLKPRSPSYCESVETAESVCQWSLLRLIKSTGEMGKNFRTPLHEVNIWPNIDQGSEYLYNQQMALFLNNK